MLDARRRCNCMRRWETPPFPELPVREDWEQEEEDIRLQQEAAEERCWTGGPAGRPREESSEQAVSRVSKPRPEAVANDVGQGCGPVGSGVGAGGIQIGYSASGHGYVPPPPGANNGEGTGPSVNISWRGSVLLPSRMTRVRTPNSV